MRVDLPQSMLGSVVIESLKSITESLGGKAQEYGHEKSYDLALGKKVLQRKSLLIDIPCTHPRVGFFSLSSSCSGVCRFVIDSIKINNEIVNFNVETRLHPCLCPTGDELWARLDRNREDAEIAEEALNKLMIELRKSFFA